MKHAGDDGKCLRSTGLLIRLERSVDACERARFDACHSGRCRSVGIDYGLHLVASVGERQVDELLAQLKHLLSERGRLLERRGKRLLNRRQLRSGIQPEPVDELLERGRRGQIERRRAAVLPAHPALNRLRIEKSRHVERQQTRRNHRKHRSTKSAHDSRFQGSRLELYKEQGARERGAPKNATCFSTPERAYQSRRTVIPRIRGAIVPAATPVPVDTYFPVFALLITELFVPVKVNAAFMLVNCTSLNTLYAWSWNLIPLFRRPARVIGKRRDRVMSQECHVG